MGILQFDEEATRQLTAVYVTPDVVAQREEFLRALGLEPGARVLDAGSGPGFLASAIASAVGGSGRVRGLDISAPFVAAARSRCAHQPWVEIIRGDVTRLPFPGDRFDVAVSTQVLEYVPDVDAAVTELHRVVRPGGRVALMDTDWDSIVWHFPDRARMNRVLDAWEAHAPHPCLPRTLALVLGRAGFRVERTAVLPLLNAHYDENTYSNRMIDLIVRFIATRRNLRSGEAEAWARDLRELGRRGEYFFSLNRYVFIASKPPR